jgi:uncharacterized protein
MRIGEFNDLRVLRDSMYGLYLGDEEGEVLLPNNQCAETMHVDDILRVFVYTDSEDRPIATRKKPIAVVGEFAKMKCVTVNGSGAFLEWGLDKDLFCPPKEQGVPMEIGREYVVRVYLPASLYADRRLGIACRATHPHHGYRARTRGDYGDRKRFHPRIFV